MEEHLGKYLVLSLSLAGFEAEDREGFVKLISPELNQLFDRFSHLQEFVHEHQRPFFHKVVEAQCSLAELSKSFLFLCPILARAYKCPLFLLLDEYDEGVNNIWEKVLMGKKGFEDLLQTAVGFFGSLKGLWAAP